MGQKSGQGEIERLPDAEGAVNVNCCVNSACPNFLEPIHTSHQDERYKLIGPKATRSISCLGCGRSILLKSNLAVKEELTRLSNAKVIAKVIKQDGTACHNINCKSFGKSSVRFPHYYRKIGFTSSGNQRYQCLECGNRFTSGSKKRTSHPMAKNHVNETLFTLICNKGVGQRLTEITGLSQATIYRKIDMFYERSLAFMSLREDRLCSLSLDWLRLCVDRQFYNINWTSRRDQRVVPVKAIATGDRESGYIFGMDVDYDPDVNLHLVQASDEFKTDLTLPHSLRKLARIWTDNDYGETVRSLPDIAQLTNKILRDLLQTDLPIPLHSSQLEATLEAFCQEGITLSDLTEETKLPVNGARVHDEYTMYAHFMKLESILGNVHRLAFYLDTEAGIDRALMCAFREQVLQGRITALYVRSNKELGTHHRQALAGISKKVLEKMVADGKASDIWDAKVRLTIEALATPIISNRPKNQVWYSVPVNVVNECEKHVSFITQVTDWNPEWIAARAVDASLQTTDTFFNMTRRRLSALERPIASAANNRNMWNGYAPYDPYQVAKLTTILRCYYNYVHRSPKDGKTPAERLGLAKGQVEIRRILYPRGN